MIKKSGDNFIWVAGNYRLGVYGWLAGKTMEKESHANIGLYGTSDSGERRLPS
jgi:carboxylesterase type B